MAWRQGLSLAVGRLRRRSGVTLVLLALVFALAVAWIEHRLAPTQAADRSLQALAGWLIPLSVFGLLAVARGQQRLDDAVWPLARYGMSRRVLVLGSLTGVAVVAWAVTAVGLGLVLGISYLGRSGLLADAATSGWICSLAAMAYLAWLALAATFLRGGGGSWLALGADFVFGAGESGIAALFPRSHLRSLLGGDAVAGLSQPQSTAALLLLLVVPLTLLLLRVRR